VAGLGLFVRVGLSFFAKASEDAFCQLFADHKE
jgi:hypothetical protein